MLPFPGSYLTHAPILSPTYLTHALILVVQVVELAQHIKGEVGDVGHTLTSGFHSTSREPCHRYVGISDRVRLKQGWRVISPS